MPQLQLPLWDDHCVSSTCDNTRPSFSHYAIDLWCGEIRCGILCHFELQ